MVEPFRPEHLDDIAVQAAQAASYARRPAGYGELLGAAGPAITVRAGGRIVACLGIGRPAPDERLLWCYIAANAPLWPIYSAIRRFLVEYGQERLYTTVEVGFAQGERAVELCGFVRSDRLPAFGFDGRDHTLFERAA